MLIGTEKGNVGVLILWYVARVGRCQTDAMTFVNATVAGMMAWQLYGQRGVGG